MNNIGIMQGRLTPSKGRGLQFFPFENWKNEFKIAAELGLAEIEWVFDHENFKENPLWHYDGRIEIKKAVAESGVNVHKICADYFIRKPFFRASDSEVRESVSVLESLVISAAGINVASIEIPLLDNSSLKSEDDEESFVQCIKRCLPAVKYYNVVLSLETDLPPERFRKLLERLDGRFVGAVYDSGNSAALGYDSEAEIKVIAEKLTNIHIKDRVYKGKSVGLGSGSADFHKLFNALKQAAYKGTFVLQAARGDDFREVQTVAEQIRFVQNYARQHLG